MVMDHIPLGCMPTWHAHPTRHVEEFWISLVTIRVPSIFVLNRQRSCLILPTVSTPKVNAFSIKDPFLLHIIHINMLSKFNIFLIATGCATNGHCSGSTDTCTAGQCKCGTNDRCLRSYTGGRWIGGRCSDGQCIDA